MKTYKLIFMAFATMIVGTFVITSCSNETSTTDTLNRSSQNERTRVTFPNSNILSSETISDPNERIEIVSKVENSTLNIENYDLNDIQKVLFIDSDIIMYSIPNRNEIEKIIIYRYIDIFQITLAEFYELPNGNRQFRISTLDNKSIYSLQLNEEDRIGNFEISNNDEFKDFSLNVSIIQEPEVEGDSGVCCRKQNGWSACMDCTASACSDSWVCVAVLALLPVETLAGFAVSCIGAGSNATC